MSCSHRTRKIYLKDKYFEKVISYQDIQKKTKEIAQKIDEVYTNKRPICLVVLNGAFYFATHLLESLHIHWEICFTKITSYNGIYSMGVDNTSLELHTSLKDRDVLIIEDIVDTGRSLIFLYDEIKKHHPTSIRTACLLKSNKHNHHYPIDFYCFLHHYSFLVGYGLDYDGWGRNLKGIYQWKEV